MRKQKPDFKNKSSNDSYYDLHEDWGLIEASLAKQYGIRIRQAKDMPWSEFCSLLSGLMADTPLGAIIAIRSEKDQKAIKAFNPEQRRIHREWKSRQAAKTEQNTDEYNKQMDMLSKMLSSMFGGG